MITILSVLLAFLVGYWLGHKRGIVQTKRQAQEEYDELVKNMFI